MDVPLYDDTEVVNLPDQSLHNFTRSNSIFFNTIMAAGFDYGVYDVGADPFVIMFKDNDEVKSKLLQPHMFRYYRPGIEEPRQVRIEQYTYRKGEKYINSIFHPKLLNINNEF